MCINAISQLDTSKISQWIKCHQKWILSRFYTKKGTEHKKCAKNQMDNQLKISLFIQNDNPQWCCCLWYLSYSCFNSFLFPKYYLLFGIRKVVVLFYLLLIAIKCILFCHFCGAECWELLKNKKYTANSKNVYYFFYLS